ncbi:hypothetical protein K0M31_009682 [Melipona bicolor]|uniref:Uncharacterized protein n=1 Tax=Melipona bicolor TaxID=60889 RepID=A0AA40KJ99_9HYME|nr:hypothetical protein K0M31_009682 [Melipona bicolor]
MEKILDSLQNEGVLTDSALEKLSNILPENAKEKLHSMYQRYQELDNEEKQQFLNEVTEMFRKKMENSWSFSSLFYSYPYIVFIFAVLFIAFVLVFFVYKLFRCLSERETKREEKKKNKQMKKKK